MSFRDLRPEGRYITLLSNDIVSGSAEAGTGWQKGGFNSVVVMGKLRRSLFAVPCLVLRCYCSPTKQPRLNNRAGKTQTCRGGWGEYILGSLSVSLTLIGCSK